MKSLTLLCLGAGLIVGPALGQNGGDQMLRDTIRKYGIPGADKRTNFYDTVCGNFKGSKIKNFTESTLSYRSLLYQNQLEIWEKETSVGDINACRNNVTKSGKQKFKEQLESLNVNDDDFVHPTKLAKVLAQSPVDIFFSSMVSSGMNSIANNTLYLSNFGSGSLLGDTGNYKKFNGSKAQGFIQEMINYFDVKDVFSSKMRVEKIANEIWKVENAVVGCVKEANEEGLQATTEGDRKALEQMNEIFSVPHYLNQLLRFYETDCLKKLQGNKKECDRLQKEVISPFTNRKDWVRDVYSNHLSAFTLGYFKCLKKNVFKTEWKSSLRQYYLWDNLLHGGWEDQASNSLLKAHKNLLESIADSGPTQYNNRNDYCEEKLSLEAHESESNIKARKELSKIFDESKKEFLEMVKEIFSINQRDGEYTDLSKRIKRLRIDKESGSPVIYSFDDLKSVGKPAKDLYSRFVPETFDYNFIDIPLIYESGKYGNSNQVLATFYVAKLVVEQSIAPGTLFYNLQGKFAPQIRKQYPILMKYYDQIWGPFKALHQDQNPGDAKLSWFYQAAPYHTLMTTDLALRLTERLIKPANRDLFLQRFSLVTCAHEGFPLSDGFTYIRPEYVNYVIQRLIDSKEANSNKNKRDSGFKLESETNSPWLLQGQDQFTV